MQNPNKTKKKEKKRVVGPFRKTHNLCLKRKTSTSLLKGNNLQPG